MRNLHTMVISLFFWRIYKCTVFDVRSTSLWDGITYSHRRCTSIVYWFLFLEKSIWIGLCLNCCGVDFVFSSSSPTMWMQCDVHISFYLVALNSLHTQCGAQKEDHRYHGTDIIFLIALPSIAINWFAWARPLSWFTWFS